MLEEILKKLDYRKVEKRIASFIKAKVREAGSFGVVLGLSGGLDSSVTAYLCRKALGSKKVLGLIMPDKETTPEEDIQDALLLVKELGIGHKLIEITPICKDFSKIPGFKEDRIAVGNLKPRTRMTLLYYFANLEKKLVVGTGDRSEYLLGYFTKYGDGGVDFLPLAGLYKTQVRELAKHIGIPEKIWKKPSSPRLWKGHEAKEELGLSYEEIDPILYCTFDKKLSKEQTIEKLGIEGWKVERVLAMHKQSMHKRKPPEICTI
jgi:NAD+ synthase